MKHRNNVKINKWMDEYNNEFILELRTGGWVVYKHSQPTNALRLNHGTEDNSSSDYVLNLGMNNAILVITTQTEGQIAKDRIVGA